MHVVKSKVQAGNDLTESLMEIDEHGLKAEPKGLKQGAVCSLVSFSPFVNELAK